MPKTVMLISHTHWDRQWYKTVQEFRLALGRMMDNLLRLLQDDPDFKVFHLDGQTAIIQDYLELRPENRAIIIRMIQEGRLKIGPWFLQPDNFLVSGEGLIRNLLKGTRYARSMGGNTSVGWLPDSFGHNAQMPQILKNFGIESFLFSRGLGDHLENEASEFIWEAPNKDRVIAILQRGGYYGGGNLAYPFFWGNIFLIEPDHDLALKRLRKIIASSEEGSASETIPIWNGADHMAPERTLSATIRHADKHLKDYTLVHGSIDDYITGLRPVEDSLQIVRGELRGSRYEPILSSVLSSRMHIKQRNYHIERALERETEPVSVCAHLMGASYPVNELCDAWDGVLKNHFHDAICGCSIDQAHKEMDYGFEKAEQTCRELNRWAMEHIAAKAVGKKARNTDINLLLFNPQLQKREDSLELSVEVPDWRKERSAVLDDGSIVPLQIIDKRRVHDSWIPRKLACSRIIQNLHLFQQNLNALDNRAITGAQFRNGEKEPELVLFLGSKAIEPEGIISSIIEKLRTFPDDLLFHISAHFMKVRMIVPVRLPACGYTSIALEKQTDKTAATAKWFSPVTAGKNFLENRHLRIDIKEKGLLDLLHKESGSLIADAHFFQDQADRGDTYDFCPVDGENQENSRLDPESVSIRVTEKGPVRAAIVIDYLFRIPDALHTSDRNRRSSRLTSLKITTTVLLTWNAPFAEIRTTIENSAKDHRLRICVPAPVKSGEVYSDGQFMISKRDSASLLRPQWASPPPQVFPHDKWFALTDGDRGIAFFSEGLPEHAVEKSDHGEILALTLLRSVGWLSRQDIKTRPGHGGPAIETPDAQCPGRYSFRYALFPFRGDIPGSSIMEAVQQFDASASAQQVPGTMSGYPGTLSFFELQPDFLQMSALKKSEDDLFVVLRFYNPRDEEVEAHLSGGRPVTGVWRSRADEKPGKPLFSGTGALDLCFPVGPHEIVTLLVRPSKEKI
jgi:mannosylglycerate hydrolase